MDGELAREILLPKNNDERTLSRTELEGIRSHEKVDERLPGKYNSNSHGARPVHLTITMMKWIRTSRLPIKNSLSVRSQLQNVGDATLNPTP